MPNIAATREEYDDLLPRWNLLRDCLSGEDKIKEGGTLYLPKPLPSDTSQANIERYAQYLERAVFYNVTGRTANGLQGQVFRKAPVVELPPLLQDMVADVDGAGVGLVQQSAKTLLHTLVYGRSFLLADYPQVDGPVSRAQLQAGMIRPSITRYDCWDIINWRMRKIGGVFKLSLVVIYENYVTDDDGFEEEYHNSWRVLRLDENNLYVMEQYIEDPDKRDQKEYVLVEQSFPTDANGRRLDYIPAVFVGSQNNDATPDLPPLYDLARLNIAHYRNSADYEESCYMCGQPTPWFSGLHEDWIKDVWKGGVTLGSRSAVPLPENGTAGLLVAPANTMPIEAMKLKEEQMVAIGAKLVEKAANVVRTATEVSIKDFGEHSILSMVSMNVSEAYEKVLGYALRFVQTAEAEIKYRLNMDFEIAKMDANEQAQLIAMWQGGAIVREEMRSALRRSGIAYLPDEDYQDALGDEDFAGLGQMIGAQQEQASPAGANQNLQNAT